MSSKQPVDMPTPEQQRELRSAYRSGPRISRPAPIYQQGPHKDSSLYRADSWGNDGPAQLTRLNADDQDGLVVGEELDDDQANVVPEERIFSGMSTIMPMNSILQAYLQNIGHAVRLPLAIDVAAVRSDHVMICLLIM